MSKEKKSIFDRLFGGSGGCSCGVQIVEEEENTKDHKESAKEQKNN
ncbi:MAG: hypothetical protein N4A62_19795 [Marinisporobacter sp.]|jgi:hypothetical protein|nr:hypothetical protein [Marinisporobacter sp.]